MIPIERDTWAGIRRVCVKQADSDVRVYTPDEARKFAAHLLYIADVADGTAIVDNPALARGLADIAARRVSRADWVLDTEDQEAADGAS